MKNVPEPGRGADRRSEPDGDERRWMAGSGGLVQEHPSVDALLEHGLGHRRRWEAAGNAVDDGLDQLQTERLLWRLVDAGLVEIHQRRDPVGRWESYEWTTAEEGERRMSGGEETETVDPSEYLEAADDEEGRPVMARIREALESDLPKRSPTLARVIIELGRQRRRGRRPTDRELSLAVSGASKRLSLERHRDQLEAMLGDRLEKLVRFPGRAVRAWGTFAFEIGPRRVAGDWSIPWLSVTEETLETMENLQTEAERIVTVENQSVFESFVREERPERTVVVYTAGFAGSLELAFLERLVEAGIETVDHWGDLDVGGLRILRHLGDELAAEVRPYRMSPELLERFPTRSLTDRDRRALRSWLQEQAAPYCSLARALLDCDAKAEQEAWYVVGGQ